MADTTTTTATTPIPTAPVTATAATVAQHHSVLQSLISGLEALPQNAANAKRYLDLKAETLATWVQAKHVKTRLLEVSAIVGGLAFIVGFFVGRLL